MNDSDSNHTTLSKNAGKQNAEIALGNARLFTERMANECHANGQYTMGYALCHLLSYLDAAYEYVMPTHTTAN